MPSILHTPLMSGSNAIHGIVLVGAMIVMGTASGAAQMVLGFFAVLLATLNIVGGFTVTDRMLEMFKAKPGDNAAKSKKAPTPRTVPSDPRPIWIDLVYLVAAVAFIVALKGLSSPKQARNGNLLAAAAAVVAVGATFFNPEAEFSHHTTNLVLTIVAMVVGAVVAVPVARLVKMTAMPQLVAIFNGVGGGAAALISIVVFLRALATADQAGRLHDRRGPARPADRLRVVQRQRHRLRQAPGADDRRPITYPAQQVINGLVGVAIVGLAVATLLTGSVTLMVVTAVLSLVLGVIFVLPIGGADVPVLISLLNSFTGLAVAASGFTLNNNLLIIAGTLVGASGILLTRMMSKAMGRSLANVLFSAFGSVVTAGGGADGTGETRQVKSGTPEDIGVLLAYARKVVIIPGYGLAVAQAQHTARELADLLMERGRRGLLRHPPGGRPHARAHERAPGRGQRALRRAEGDGRGQPGDVHGRRRPRGRAPTTRSTRRPRTRRAAPSTACRSSTPTRPPTSSSSSGRCVPGSPASTTTSSSTRRRRCCSATPRTR